MTTATMSTTSNNFSTSTSSFRASRSQHTPLTTMSDFDTSLTQLPTIDFNFDDLRKRMSEFTNKFDAFIKRGQERVLEERNGFRGRLGELNEEQRSTAAQITSLQSTLQTHNTSLSREQREKDEINTQITSLQTRQSNHVAHRDRLRTEIAQTQRRIDAQLEEQRKYAAEQAAQAQQNGPEVDFWSTYLGCRIEGAGMEGLLRIFFTFPPAAKVTATAASASAGSVKEEREAWFELKIPEIDGRSEYKVVYTKPRLDGEKVDRFVKRLSETGDIAVLLKGMRGLFMEELK